MRRLWDMEFYKMRKSLYLKLSCLGAILYGFAEFWVASLTYQAHLCGFTALMGSFVNWEKAYLFCGIFAAFYISGDLEGGGIEEEIIGGFDKRQIYIVKTGMFFLGSMAVILCYQLVPTIVFSCLHGFTDRKTEPLWHALLGMEGIYLILMAACIGLCLLFSFVFQKKAGSIIAEVLYIMILLPIFQNAALISETTACIYQVFPYHKLSLIVGNIVENCNISAGLILPPETAGLLGHIPDVGGILLCAGIAFLLPALSGYLVFRYLRFK